MKKQALRLGGAIVFLVLAVCLMAVAASADSYTYGVANTVYLKEFPSYDSADIVFVPGGSAVDMVASRDGWYQVGYQGHNGWIPAGQVTVVAKPSSSSSGSGWRGADTMTYTTANLNLRQGPSGSAAVITVIPAGTQVYLQSYGNGWAYVSWGYDQGYVSAQYLTYFNGGSGGGGGATPDPVPVPSNWSAVKANANTSGAVNMRTGPGTSYARITVIPQGATVLVNYQGDGWAQVTYNGSTGYCSCSYLAF